MGKTIQVISLLLAIYHKTGITSIDKAQISDRRRNPQQFRKVYLKPSLLVMPNSVMENWKNELDAWSTFSIREINKDTQDADVLLESQVMGGMIELILIPYSMLQKHIDILKRISWGVIVFDEGIYLL